MWKYLVKDKVQSNISGYLLFQYLIKLYPALNTKSKTKTISATVSWEIEPLHHRHVSPFVASCRSWGASSKGRKKWKTMVKGWTVVFSVIFCFEEAWGGGVANEETESEFPALSLLGWLKRHQWLVFQISEFSLQEERTIREQETYGLRSEVRCAILYSSLILDRQGMDAQSAPVHFAEKRQGQCQPIYSSKKTMSTSDLILTFVFLSYFPGLVVVFYRVSLQHQGCKSSQTIKCYNIRTRRDLRMDKAQTQHFTRPRGLRRVILGHAASSSQAMLGHASPALTVPHSGQSQILGSWPAASKVNQQMVRKAKKHLLIIFYSPWAGIWLVQGHRIINIWVPLSIIIDPEFPSIIYYF